MTEENLSEKEINDENHEDHEDGENTDDSTDSEPADVNQIKTKVVDYIKIDDKLRELMKEVKRLKDERKQPEEKIKNFLKKSKMDFIGVDGDNDKIVREEVEKKTAVKPDIIKESIKECLIEENLFSNEDEEKCMKFIEKITQRIEDKREIVKSINIKRDKKAKKEKKDKNTRKK